MTDRELEDIYRAAADENHSTALRMVYNLGYSAGSGQALTTLSSNPVKAQPKPADSVIATAKVVTKKSS